jgi:hypothetical protein
MSYAQQPLLIAVSHDPLRVVTSRQRPWDGVLARWRSLTLDTQLAAGDAAEDQRLRLVRASQLTSPGSRDELAARWESLLARCLSPKPRRLPQGAAIPMQRRQIVAAQAEIRRLVRALRSGIAVQARGVAIASVLLTDGTGPLYNPAQAHMLKRSVLVAADHLDPETLLRAS